MYLLCIHISWDIRGYFVTLFDQWTDFRRKQSNIVNEKWGCWKVKFWKFWLFWKFQLFKKKTVIFLKNWIFLKIWTKLVTLLQYICDVILSDYLCFFFLNYRMFAVVNEINDLITIYLWCDTEWLFVLF